MGMLLTTLLFSALFSGTEIAFVSANRLKIELFKEKGSLAGKILASFYQKPARFISMLLIGNNISLVAFSILMTELLDFQFTGAFSFLNNEASILLIQTLIITVVVLIFGEFFPKVFFRLKPASVLKALSLPMRFIYFLLYPINAIFTFFSRAIIRLILRKEYSEEKQQLNAVDLEYFIRETSSRELSEDREDDELNTEFFEKALYLKEVKVKECMVPRTEVVSHDIKLGLDALCQRFIDSKHSRILVYDNSIDNVLGYVHHNSIFQKPQNVKKVLFDIPVVPLSMNARDLLAIFTMARKNIARVVDEYGGTAGIVTLEDIMEEIFGEIQDEHDQEDLVEHQINDTEFTLSGRLEIDYLNEKHDLGLPKADYETLAGYITAVHKDLPEEGQTLHLDNFTIKILSASENTIETILLKVLDIDE